MTLRHILLLIGVIVLATLAVPSSATAQEQTLGLFLNAPGSFDGYTLLAPLRYTKTYLIDNEGQVVHSWDTGGGVTSAYLLEDGSLIQTDSFSGRFEQFDWDGTLLWQFEYANADHQLHHDIEVLPNGNVLAIAYEFKDAGEAIAAGRDPALLAEGALWPEHIIEVERTGLTTGSVVWEWHMWDHLVQDVDSGQDNFGVVADHPELIDVNYFEPSRPTGGEADWIHANAIDYNEALDQIVLSARHFGELWVIDHSTTEAEAASHAGGSSGKGGDLLYRWGNSAAYDAGTVSDQRLFLAHDTHWIDPGLPGAGNIMVFNNGNGRPGTDYSSVEEISPPVDVNGDYALTPGQAYGPATTTWTYTADVPTDFYSSFISGAVRLPNGNTLICSGAEGIVFEVTPDNEIVWLYVNPATRNGPLLQGTTPSANFVFRAYRYAPDYPGLAGRDLTPGAPIEISDSDKDGLSDYAEINTHNTDPFVRDTDGDGLADGEEVNGTPSADPGLGTLFSDPLVPDTDADGCTDYQEAGGNASRGGRRNPMNQYDYFNPTHDGRNRADDISAVVRQYFVDAGNPAYREDTDRTLLGPNGWNTGPPDGKQRAADIIHMVKQYFHDCA